MTSSLLEKIYVWFKTEPTSFQAAVQAFLAMGLIFGWWHWSVQQTGAVVGLVAVLLSLVVRSQVTPTYNVHKVIP